MRSSLIPVAARRAYTSAAVRGSTASVQAMAARAPADTVSNDDIQQAAQAGLNAIVGDIISQKKAIYGTNAEKKKTLCVKESDSVLDAVKKMTTLNVGALVVMSTDGDLSGIITERDYLHKIVVLGRTSHETKVKDIMTDTNKLVTVGPDTPVFAAMNLMTKRRFRHLPVVQEGAWKDGRVQKSELLGMLSLGDCVFSVVDEIGEQMTAMEHYIQGTY